MFIFKVPTLRNVEKRRSISRAHVIPQNRKFRRPSSSPRHIKGEAGKRHNAARVIQRQWKCHRQRKTYQAWTNLVRLCHQMSSIRDRAAKCRAKFAWAKLKLTKHEQRLKYASKQETTRFRPKVRNLKDMIVSNLASITMLGHLESMEEKKQVVLDAATTPLKTLESLGYRLQGNIEHYTTQALLQRKMLSHKRELQAMTSLFWNLLTAQTPGAKTIGKEQYLDLFLRVTKVLMPNWTETEGRALVEVDWQQESRNNALTYDQLHTSLFELADLWVDSVELEAYKDWLLKLLWCITCIPPDPRFTEENDSKRRNVLALSRNRKLFWRLIRPEELDNIQCALNGLGDIDMFGIDVFSNDSAPSPTATPRPKEQETPPPKPKKKVTISIHAKAKNDRSYWAKSIKGNETKKEESEAGDEQAKISTPEKQQSHYQDKLWTFPVLEASANALVADPTFPGKYTVKRVTEADLFRLEQECQAEVDKMNERMPSLQQELQRLANPDPEEEEEEEEPEPPVMLTLRLADSISTSKILKFEQNKSEMQRIMENAANNAIGRILKRYKLNDKDANVTRGQNSPRAVDSSASLNKQTKGGESLGAKGNETEGKWVVRDTGSKLLCTLQLSLDPNMTLRQLKILALDQLRNQDMLDPELAERSIHSFRFRCMHGDRPGLVVMSERLRVKDIGSGMGLLLEEGIAFALQHKNSITRGTRFIHCTAVVLQHKMPGDIAAHVCETLAPKSAQWNLENTQLGPSNNTVVHVKEVTLTGAFPLKSLQKIVCGQLGVPDEELAQHTLLRLRSRELRAGMMENYAEEERSDWFAHHKGWAMPLSSQWPPVAPNDDISYLLLNVDETANPDLHPFKIIGRSSPRNPRERLLEAANKVMFRGNAAKYDVLVRDVFGYGDLLVVVRPYRAQRVEDDAEADGITAVKQILQRDCNLSSQPVRSRIRDKFVDMQAFTVPTASPSAESLSSTTGHTRQENPSRPSSASVIVKVPSSNNVENEQENSQAELFLEAENEEAPFGPTAKLLLGLWRDSKTQQPLCRVTVPQHMQVSTLKHRARVLLQENRLSVDAALFVSILYEDRDSADGPISSMDTEAFSSVSNYSSQHTIGDLLGAMGLTQTESAAYMRVAMFLQPITEPPIVGQPANSHPSVTHRSKAATKAAGSAASKAVGSEEEGGVGESDEEESGWEILSAGGSTGSIPSTKFSVVHKQHPSKQHQRKRQTRVIKKKSKVSKAPIFPFRNDYKNKQRRQRRRGSQTPTLSLQSAITSQVVKSKPVAKSKRKSVSRSSTPRTKVVRVVPQRTGILKQLGGAGVEFGFPNIKSISQKRRKHYFFKEPAPESKGVADQAVLDIRPASATVRPRAYVDSTPPSPASKQNALLKYPRVRLFADANRDANTRKTVTQVFHSNQPNFPERHPTALNSAKMLSMHLQSPRKMEETNYDYDLTDEIEDEKNWSLEPANAANPPTELATDVQAKKTKKKPKKLKSWRPPRSRSNSVKSSITSPQNSMLPRTQSARVQRRASMSSRKKYLEVKMGKKKISGKLETRRDVRSAPRSRRYVYSGQKAVSPKTVEI